MRPLNLGVRPREERTTRALHGCRAGDFEVAQHSSAASLGHLPRRDNPLGPAPFKVRTSSLSQGRGYRIFRTERLSPQVELVFMEKLPLQAGPRG